MYRSVYTRSGCANMCSGCLGTKKENGGLCTLRSDPDAADVVRLAALYTGNLSRLVDSSAIKYLLNSLRKRETLSQILK